PPSPALQVPAVTAAGPDSALPDHVRSGQPITVNYTVANVGPGDVRPTTPTWVDDVYLSRDPILDPADYFLGYATHTGALAAGDSYQRTLTFKAPRDLGGPWYVCVITDPSGGPNGRGSVYEGAKGGGAGVWEGANETTTAPPPHTPLFTARRPPADLVINTITVPASAQSGQPVHLSWTGKNIGLNSAVGSWSDAVYLSSDPV